MGDRLALHPGRFPQRPAFAGHPIDPPVAVVAIGIAHVVLQVADQRVVPVGDIEGPIAADLQVAGSKIRIGRNHNRFDFFGANIRAVVLDLVL